MTASGVPDLPLLRRRGFRLLVSAQLLGSAGVWMLRMAADWLVLELTGSSAAVGLLVALQFLPLLVAGPFAGVLVDRHDKRRLVILAQAATAGVAVALAALTLTGVVTVWHLYALSVVLGLIGAVDMPARQVLVNEVSGDTRLRAAISLNNGLNQGGGLIGPAAAGLLIAELGQGWSFALNAILCLAVVALIAAIRPSELERVPVAGWARGQLAEGFAFVRARPHLFWVVVLAGLMGALGLNGPVVYTALADEVWQTGARGFGLYNSVGAAGAVVGALLSARLRRLRLRTLVLGSGLFAAAETTLAVMPTHATFLVLVALVGLATLLFLSSAATWVQLATLPSVRGRVLAIYSPVLLGGHACGGLLQGWLAEHLGVRTGLALTGALAVAATAVVGLALLRGDRRRARAATPDAAENPTARAEPDAPGTDPTPGPGPGPGPTTQIRPTAEPRPPARH